jgi:hypothetical protein
MTTVHPLRYWLRASGATRRKPATMTIAAVYHEVAVRIPSGGR